MSFPTIPAISPTITINRMQVANLLLASTAFEELGLAHLLNVEGEKLQAALGTLPGLSVTVRSFANLLTINQSVNRTLQTLLKNQMLLQFKLEDIIAISPSTSSVVLEGTVSETVTVLLANFPASADVTLAYKLDGKTNNNDAISATVNIVGLGEINFSSSSITEEVYDDVNGTLTVTGLGTSSGALNGSFQFTLVVSLNNEAKTLNLFDPNTQVLILSIPL